MFTNLQSFLHLDLESRLNKKTWCYNVLSWNSLKTNLYHYTPDKVHHHHPQIVFIWFHLYLRSMQAAIPLLCTLLNIKSLLLLMLHEAGRTSRHRDAAAAMLVQRLGVTTQGCQIHVKKNSKKTTQRSFLKLSTILYQNSKSTPQIFYTTLQNNTIPYLLDKSVRKHVPYWIL